MANLSYTAAEIDTLLGKADTAVQPETTGDLDNLQTTDKDNLVDAINELFTSVSNGKSAIAAAITDKGVATAATDSFADMAQNIEDIPTGSTPVLQTKSVTPTESAQTVTADVGYDGLEEVDVAAIPSNYVGSGVARKSSSDIHPSTSDQSIASDTYLTGAQTVKAVTLANLTADNIKNGVTVKVGDSTDDDCVASVTGTYSGGGGKNIQVDSNAASVHTTSYSSTGVTITVAKTGTYKVSWMAARGSSSGTMGTNLYVNGSAGINQQTWQNTYAQHIVLNNQSYNAGDVLTLYATAGSTTRYCWAGNLIIEEQ